jgi:hypothetical protein
VTIPKSVLQHLARLRRGLNPLHVARNASDGSELKSFGVYLGPFDYPATPAQSRLLSQWDIVALNPLASGVTDALSACAYTSPRVLGRLEVRSLMESERGSNAEQIIRSIRILDETITNFFLNGASRESPFTAVLLADFADHFSPPVLNELVGYINALGYEVWLELSHPDYLPDAQCREINMRSIGGIIYRNGTIRTDGNQQDFHQMSAMRTTMRAVAAQRVVHGPPMMLWETVDEDCEHQYAVTQRSFNWCRYNSALCWIGSASALNDAEVAAVRTISEKPLGALMWMKNDSNMDAHNIWRHNDKVRSSSQRNLLNKLIILLDRHHKR